MPKGDFGHRGYAHWPEHRRVLLDLEATPDLSRGEIRLAAEALLATLDCRRPPEPVMDRALAIAQVMAHG